MKDGDFGEAIFDAFGKRVINPWRPGPPPTNEDVAATERWSDGYTIWRPVWMRKTPTSKARVVFWAYGATTYDTPHGGPEWYEGGLDYGTCWPGGAEWAPVEEPG